MVRWWHPARSNQEGGWEEKGGQPACMVGRGAVRSHRGVRLAWCL